MASFRHHRIGGLALIRYIQKAIDQNATRFALPAILVTKFAMSRRQV
jgi:hypothetical protein